VTTFPGYAHSQTTIVAVRTPQEIWIGADSKVAAIHDKSITRSECKIRQADSLFFAFAGLPEYRRTGYDLVAIVKKAGRNGLILSDKVKTFDRLIVTPLSKALKRIKSYQPAYFRQKIEGKAVIQILFAGIEKGVPIFFMRTIKAESHDGDSPSLTIHKVSCPGKDCPTGEIVAYLGHNRAISSFLAGKGNFWEIGYADGIRKLITVETEAEPDNVGPPIDILRIGRRWAEWVQKKPECQEIRK